MRTFPVGVGLSPLSDEGDERRPVSELMVRRILDLVRSGSLAPGDRLPPERDLAQQFEVSRPTVREALRALAILGVIEIRHGGGVFVTSLEPSALLEPLDFLVSLNARNMSELFDARIVYEPAIAALAAERMGEETLAQIAGLVAAQLARPEDAELFHDTDVELHKLILEASDNFFLTRIGRILQLLGDPARRAFQKRKSIRLQSIRDHEAILEALRSRDPEIAGRAMRQHMVNVRNALREVLGA